MNDDGELRRENRAHKVRLPGKARGFRGQDTVERHGGLDVVMEKIVQWEQETPASNGREIIDDSRLWGVKDVASYRWTTH